MGREQLGPRTQRASTHIPPGSAAACFEPPTSETPEQTKKDREKPEPGSGERKGKRKRRKSRKKRPAGARSRRQGLTLCPAAPKPQLRRGTNNAASVRGRHASAEAGGGVRGPRTAQTGPCSPVQRGRRPVEGGKRMPGRGELPYPGSPGHHDGFPWGWFPTRGWDGDAGWGSGPRHPRGGRESGAQDPKQTLPGEPTGAKHAGFALRRA